MPNFLDKCEEYFDSRDFYEILSVDKNAPDKEIKKAYHKMSLLVHPDRVEEKQKISATEKFKVLGRIHSILQDPDKRKIYNETGEFDEEGDPTCNWMQYWRSMFKPITKKDIEDYEKQYIGSDKELRDIKKAYAGSKGNMDHILEMVPFSNCDAEPRIIEIVRKMVDDGEVEEYTRFFNESERKKQRRRRKWEEEKEEVEKLNVNDADLEKEIQERHKSRETEFFSFLSKLEDKYTDKKGGTKRKSIENNPKPATSTKKRTTRSKK